MAGFISNGSSDLNSQPGGQRVQNQIGIIDPATAFTNIRKRPKNERGNAYLEPNGLLRGMSLGTTESFDCKPEGGQLTDPVDGTSPLDTSKRPPCFVAPPSLYSGKKYNFQRKGNAPVKSPPQDAAGRRPPTP